MSRILHNFLRFMRAHVLFSIFLHFSLVRVPMLLYFTFRYALISKVLFQFKNVKNLEMGSNVRLGWGVVSGGRGRGVIQSKGIRLLQGD